MLYVLQVTTGKETLISSRLEEMGIKNLVPKSFRYKRIKSKWIGEESVVFKGYIFIDAPYNAKNYYKMMSIDGVVRLLKTDEVLKLSYSEEEIIRLIANEKLVAQIVRLKKADSLDENLDEKYELVSDMLKKFESKIVSIDKRRRSATIEITLMNEVHKLVVGIDIV